MSSGQHFQPGIPLTGTTSFTASDVDTSTTGLRLASGRLIGIKKATAPTSSDSPDYQQLLWVKPLGLGDASFDLYAYNATGFGSWVPVKGLMDLANSEAKTMPVDRLVPSTQGKILSSVLDGIYGTKAAWIDIPPAYTLGAAGTVLQSNGSSAAFSDLQGEAVHSASVSTQVLPLLSNGSGNCQFVKLPPAAVAPGSSSAAATLLTSRYGLEPAWEPFTVDTISASGVTTGYVPTVSSGSVVWANPKLLANDTYETPISARVRLDGIGDVTAGNYNSQLVDTLTWTSKAPVDVQVYLECFGTANNGYAIGDRIPVSALRTSDGSKSAFFRVSSGAVTVVLFGKYAQVLTNPSGTVNFVNLNTNAAYWRYVVVASKV